MEMGLFLFLSLFILLYVSPLLPQLSKFKPSILLPLIFVSFIICLIIYPQLSFKSAQYGFALWLNVVFPSLLPFFIAANLLQGTGFIKALGVILEPVMRPLFNVPGIGAFAFAMGISSGYPVGAKITADLRQSGACSKHEAERLLTFTNNSSPLFITGAVATGILGRPDLGILLLVTHIMASITVGLLFRFYKKNQKDAFSRYKSTEGNILLRAFGELTQSNDISFNNLGLKLGDSIKNSINTLLMICGFMVLYCVIINLLISLKVVLILSFAVKFLFQHICFAYSMASPLICGLFEITTGINYLIFSFAPMSQKLVITALILGWGGLSVHSQVASIIAGTDISVKPYFLGKLIHGVMASFYTFIFLNIPGLMKNIEVPVFNNTHDMTTAGLFMHSGDLLGAIAVPVLLITLLIIVTSCILGSCCNKRYQSIRAHESLLKRRG